ncbi:MAG: hypothetical protein KQJ78_09930 [Deltaproteobacteria bacterium]|nr:hypothetical protein [Deltaproteobacteria bacterium]
MPRRIVLLCLAVGLLGLLGALAAFPVPAGAGAPLATPFEHNVGIIYDPWFQSWTSYSPEQQAAYVNADLDTLTRDFRLFHTYHDVAVGTPDLEVDGGQAAIMQYAKAHPDLGIEVFLCTNEATPGAAALGSPGYAAKWVQAVLLDPLGDKESVLKVVKAIGLGNEVDSQTVFSAAEMGTAMQNLTKALSDAGLGGIPVTTTIANLKDNKVAAGYVDQVVANWQKAWGTEFVGANNYPWMQNGDVDTLKTWYADVQQEYPSLGIYITETGYPYVSDPKGSFDAKFPAVSGGAGEYDFTTGLLDWLHLQYVSPKTNGHTVPTFLFSGTDMPKKVAGDPTCSENNYGLYKRDPKTNALTLMTDSKGRTLQLPAWLAQTHAEANQK